MIKKSYEVYLLQHVQNKLWLEFYKIVTDAMKFTFATLEQQFGAQVTAINKSIMIVNYHELFYTDRYQMLYHIQMQIWTFIASCMLIVGW